MHLHSLKPFLFCLTLLCVAVSGLSAQAEDRTIVIGNESLYSVRTTRDYDEVIEDVKFAIANHNFRITGGNVIGSAIADRHGLDFPKSEVVHFCNLEYARRMIELSTETVRHMPCKIIVRETADRQVVVEARLLPLAEAELGELTNEVNDILRSMIDESVE